MDEVRLKRNWSVIPLLACAAVGTATAARAESAEPDDPETRAIMAEIVESLEVLLPLSFDGERFRDPGRRESIDAALAKLARNASRLRDHGAERDAGFAQLSRALARDTAQIRSRFEANRIDETRSLLHQITDACVACHSRLPDARPHPLGRRFIEMDAIRELPAAERVQFEVATRQFERALASYEALFADPQTSLADLDLTGHFESYLELCLRVERDPARALAQLERLQTRSDLPERLRRLVAAWIPSLRQLEAVPPGSALERARAWIGPQPAELRAPDDSQLVPLIAASGALHRFVNSGSATRTELGEAYFLLGVVESRVGRSRWASQTENFLEAAIRLGPDQPYAGQAFTLLEEFLISGYSGSGGTHIPADVTQRMEVLQELIDADRSADG